MKLPETAHHPLLLRLCLSDAPEDHCMRHCVVWQRGALQAIIIIIIINVLEVPMKAEVQLDFMFRTDPRSSWMI